MPDITRVSRFGFVNCYLVKEDDGLTLVDAMIPGSAKAIQTAAAKLGAPIVRIALTHAHTDHIGSLDALHALLPEAEVLISSRDARLLSKDLTLDPDEPQTKLRGGLPGAATKPTRTVEEGELVGSLQVIATPGHTPGHVSFLDPRSNTLICGDAFSTLGGVATTAKPNWKFPLPATATWHKPTELESAKKLLALNPGTGLDTARVVQEAAQIADTDGLAGVTLARVAQSLGVRAPSLYNHVEGLPGLRRLITILSLGELTDVMRDAAVGRSGEDALRSVARAYRGYALEHPGRYAATIRAPAPDDGELVGAGLRAVEVLVAVLDAWGFTGDEVLHRVRVVRAALHGFISIEAEGGFGMALSLDESFELVVQTLVAGLEQG
jgi:glyoxylase-like metal-dependent hydrolase (beta-lactamase superfamily II)